MRLPLKRFQSSPFNRHGWNILRNIDYSNSENFSYVIGFFKHSHRYRHWWLFTCWVSRWATGKSNLKKSNVLSGRSLSVSLESTLVITNALYAPLARGNHQLERLWNGTGISQFNKSHVLSGPGLSMGLEYKLVTTNAFDGWLPRGNQLLEIPRKG